MLTRISLLFYALWIGGVVAFRRLFHGPSRPGWSFAFETVVEITRRLILRGSSTLDSSHGRSQLDALTLPPRASRRVRTELGTLAGLPIETHTPSDWQVGKPTVLYFHGGGYVTCSPATHRELLRRIAIASGARCIAPNYRKAPEHVFPAAVDDAHTCYQALLASGVAPRTLFVGGDSAGGGLALALMLRLRDAGETLPRAALLLSPWVDLEGTFETLHSHAPFDYLSHDLIVNAAKVYAGEASIRHPHISPLHADLSGLPPLLVQTGGSEVFFAENVALVAKAREAGVEVTHQVSDHMVHVFQAFSQVSRAGSAAIAQIGAFVREHQSAEPAAASDDALQNPSVALQR